MIVSSIMTISINSRHLILLDRSQGLGNCLIDQPPRDSLVDESGLLADPAHLDLVLLLQRFLVGQVQAKWWKGYILATLKSASSQVSLEKSTF